MALRQDAPLTVKLVRGQLVIRIGIGILADGYEQSKHGQPFSDSRNEFLQAKVTDPEQFAKEVRQALVDEKEDGSTPVSDLLDRACRAAVEDGAEGVEYPRGDS